jgi:phosphoglucosamine mutase
VLADLNAHDLSLGGEQSGHVVIPAHATTGDGTLTGLSLMARMAKTGKTLRELAAVMTVLPQTLINVPVEDKERIHSSSVVADAVAAAEAELGDDGRVLLRPSGTEQVYRVMVEAVTSAEAKRVAGKLAAVVVAEG